VSANVLTDGGTGDTGAGSFGFLHTGKRQGTDGRKAASNEAGTAQETTTIEANARLTADGRCKIATTRLALCSLDQHGSASLSSDNG
jgi:hypothetical protein